MAQNYSTRSREYIAEYLKNNSDRILSAHDIYYHLESNDMKVNLATIYRNLDRMTCEGTVIKLKSADNDKAVYQYAGHDNCCNSHVHMQCTKCGKIIHLDCGFMKEISEHLMEHHDFTLECKNSVLYGICSQCKKDSI